MKRTYIAIVVRLLLFAATACTTNTSSTVPLETIGGRGADVQPVDVTVGGEAYPYPVVGVWHGIIPCINCPGIVYDLTLNEDYTFEETMVYQDLDEQPSARRGNWRIVDGVLELDYPDAERSRFDLSTAGELRMLDQGGNPIETPLADRYRLRREVDLSDDSIGLGDQRKQGVDFVATGNEPGWSLAIDLEDKLLFKTRPSETTLINATVPEPVIRGNTTTYRAQTEAGKLIVELVETPCTDPMSGKVLPFTVRVRANGERFIGCGQYLGEEPLD